MTASSSGKVCVHCGEDCSEKPRIKDSHDNYYCKTCHEKVEKKLRKREGVIPSPVPQKIIANDNSDSDIPMVDTSHDHDHGDLLTPEDDTGSADYDAIMQEVEVEPEDENPDDLLLLEDDDD